MGKNENRNTFRYAIYKYGVVLALLCEISSLFIREFCEDYSLFGYVLTTQLSLLFFCLSFVNLPRAIMPCKRKKVAMYFLSSYYVFNVACLFVRPENCTYTTYISVGMLLSSLFIILKTLKIKK